MRMLLCISVLMVQVTLAQVSPHGAIRFECSTCHGTESWEMRKDAEFNHASTGFALSGQHKLLQCISCHEQLKFAAQSPNCLSCHTDVHKSDLGTNCVKCHTTQSWQIPDMIQKHQQTRFPLVGRHATASCQSCHTNAAQQQYVGTTTSCIGCHRVDWESTQNPNHTAAGFSTDCMRCHRITAFAWGQGFDHNLTRFPLRGAHAATSCISCHQGGVFTGTPTECIACHSSDFNGTANPNHVAARFSTNCQECHDATTTWAGGHFDHHRTRFPLTGAHQPLQCSSCHGDNVYAGKPTDCVACHRQVFEATTNPNHIAGGFPQQCQICHTTAAWLPSSFNHNSTSFPLTGAHQAVLCAQCHVNNNYQNIPTACFDCHNSDFNGTTNPNHLTGNFPHDCTQCHTTSGWSPASFDHNLTSFPLTGAHTTAQCLSCHINGNYQLTFNSCYQCHQSQFAIPTEPNHVLGNFNHDCRPCHTTTVWRPSTFNHGNTIFPLTGAHAAVACSQCHVNGNYQTLPTVCYDCHVNDFTTSTNPNHVANNFSHDCIQCHTTTGWSPASFDHNLTNFPLTGAHTTTQCLTCHVNGNYQLTFTDCYQCHQAQFAIPTEPNHVAGNFNHDCRPCHTTTAWRPSTFNHGNTIFPLTGAHTAVTCSQCHINNNYQTLPTVCYDCHLNDFNTSTNPNHVANNFPHDCTQCHTTAGWSPASFDHNLTNFPLTGAHMTTPCLTCHVNGNYQLTFNTCYQCHQSQFAIPTNPNHVLGNFNHDCRPCHTTTSWLPSTFNHNNTIFPLTGAHQATPCAQCHVNNNYQNLPTVCYDCHLNDFNGTTNPNHLAGNFPHDCTQCHTTSGWSPATFNHALTNFPLTGAHISRPCVSCHINGNYQLQYVDCYQCHQTQYQQATNPNHVQLLFSHDCTPCHTTTAWLPSTFNHDQQYFRIYSGAHRNRWTSCQQCHPTLGNYQNFTCISCHEHRQSEMDNEHRNVPGYVYSSPACYNCHRNVL
jgi:NMD protein affecting ribosome stability and mRNA decay